MKKLKLFVVALAMVSLASCNFEEKKENVIRYEVNAENPADSYVAEIIPGKIFYDRDEDLTNNKETYRKVRVGGKRYTLGAMLICSGESGSNDVVYKVAMPKDKSSFVMTFEEKKEVLSREQFKSVLVDYVKNSGVISDTIYKPSYNLVVVDNDKYADATDVDQAIIMYENYAEFITDDVYYTRITNRFQPTSIDDFVQCIWMLTNNLRTFHHIPVLHTDDYAFSETRIKIKPEFYSEQKSVEEVNEMLSEYGLSLVPTGEEMMVVTFRDKK